MHSTVRLFGIPNYLDIEPIVVDAPPKGSRKNQLVTYAPGLAVDFLDAIDPARERNTGLTVVIMRILRLSIVARCRESRMRNVQFILLNS